MLKSIRSFINSPKYTKLCKYTALFVITAIAGYAIHYLHESMNTLNFLVASIPVLISWIIGMGASIVYFNKKVVLLNNNPNSPFAVGDPNELYIRIKKLIDEAESKPLDVSKVEASLKNTSFTRSTKKTRRAKK